MDYGNSDLYKIEGKYTADETQLTNAKPDIKTF